MLHIVTEAAGEVRAALLVDHGLKFLRPQADEGPLHPVPAAVAAVLDGAPLQDLQVEIRQSVPQHSLRVRIIPQKSRHRPCGHQATLHLGDDILAGGYLIQLLPGAEEGLIDKIEAGVRRVGSVSHALSRGLDAQGLLEEVLSDFQLEVLETHPVEYRCSCSRERVSRALISMGREELSSLIAEQGQADLSCQFCDKVYHFSKEELEGLLSSM